MNTITVDKITESQAKILRVLAPTSSNQPKIDWPLYTAKLIRELAGYSPTNSLNRLLNGQGGTIGMVTLGLVEIIVLDVEGINERNFQITEKGIQCLNHHEKKRSNVRK